MRIKNRVLGFLHKRINNKNRKRLQNMSPTLICSNCLGGFIYHWLGLKFQSPFINLFLTPDDFVEALENFDEFLNTPIRELKDSKMNYPVGVGARNIKIHFMHYHSFDYALEKWNERKLRIDKNNMGIMLSNYEGGGELLKRFDDLPYKHKVVFVSHPIKGIESAVYLKNQGINKNLYRTVSLSGKRCIDQFDYVDFINKLQELPV